MGEKLEKKLDVGQTIRTGSGVATATLVLSLITWIVNTRLGLPRFTEAETAIVVGFWFGVVLIVRWAWTRWFRRQPSSPPSRGAGRKP